MKPDAEAEQRGGAAEGSIGGCDGDDDSCGCCNVMEMKVIVVHFQRYESLMLQRLLMFMIYMFAPALLSFSPHLTFLPFLASTRRRWVAAGRRDMLDVSFPAAALPGRGSKSSCAIMFVPIYRSSLSCSNLSATSSSARSLSSVRKQSSSRAGQEAPSRPTGTCSCDVQSAEER